MNKKNAILTLALPSCLALALVGDANAGPEKILFASDYPYSHPAIELKKIELLVKNKGDLDLILYKNAKRLLGL